jgi:hypothetical protein
MFVPMSAEIASWVMTVTLASLLFGIVATLGYRWR